MPSENFQTAFVTFVKPWRPLRHHQIPENVGRILVSDICRNLENLVLRTSVGFENPSYALRRNEAWETLKKIVVCQINKGRLKLFRRPLLIYAQYVYA